MPRGVRAGSGSGGGPAARRPADADAAGGGGDPRPAKRARRGGATAGPATTEPPAHGGGAGEGAGIEVDRAHPAGENGHGANGHAANGHAAHGERDRRELTAGGFYKDEYVRLLEQALHGLGFGDLADRLERESGVALHSAEAKAFSGGLLQGAWAECLDLLDRLEIRKPEDKQWAQFKILEEKFLESLESGDLPGGLECLRTELTAMDLAEPDAQRIHELAACVLCRTPAELYAKAGWRGTAAGSRAELLRELQTIIPPTVMVPEGRLDALLHQALDDQINRCTYHNATSGVMSLLADHKCDESAIPSKEHQVLEAHSNEVWHLQFSHDGRRLATASLDGTAIIWEMDREGLFQTQHFLRDHDKCIAYLAWSPDDKYLATCSNDKTVILWHAGTGEMMFQGVKHEEVVTSCAWLPGGTRFITGGLDKHVYQWDVKEGKASLCFKLSGCRINDLAVAKSGKWLFTSSNEKKFRLYRMDEPSLESERTFEESDSIISLCLSPDDRFLLVNLQNQKVHLWDFTNIDLGDFPTSPIARYSTDLERQGRYVVRSCFGGGSNTFVVSGCEDSQVYIWHKLKGHLLRKLKGHSGTVNAVSWNPRYPTLLASASDDHSVRIWSTETA